MTFTELRKKKRVTQTKLAAALHKTQTLISKWESSVCFPSICELPTMAKIFNCSIEDIVYCFCEKV